MEQTIEVYVCEPHNKQYYKEIPNDIKAIQDIVDGHVELIPVPQLAKEHILIACDEEAKLKGNKERSVWMDVDWILGTCCFVKVKYGKFATLSEKDKKAVERYMSGETTMTDTQILQHYMGIRNHK